MTKPLVFAANWKMHHGPAAGAAFFETFATQTAPRADRTYWFFVPAVTLAVSAQACAEREDMHVGAQHVHWEAKGAYTGELSIPLVRDVGASGSLVGHSERRHIFGETDEQTGKKVRALLAAGLTPMLCVGETLDEREAGKTVDVVRRQLAAGLSGVEGAGFLIAYEPVWAIGTGRTALPEDAAEVHRAIRAALDQRGTPRSVPILYGGSVNAGNVASLVAEPAIDGVLVGGASLDAQGWVDLIRLAG